MKSMRSETLILKFMSLNMNGPRLVCQGMHLRNITEWNRNGLHPTIENKIWRISQHNSKLLPDQANLLRIHGIYRNPCLETCRKCHIVPTQITKRRSRIWFIDAYATILTLEHKYTFHCFVKSYRLKTIIWNLKLLIILNSPFLTSFQTTIVI